MTKFSRKTQDFLKFSQNWLKVLILNPITKPTQPTTKRKKAWELFRSFYYGTFILNVSVGYFLMIIYAIVNRHDFMKATIQLPQLISGILITMKALLVWTKRYDYLDIVERLNGILEKNLCMEEKSKVEDEYKKFSNLAKRFKIGFSILIFVNGVGPIFHFVCQDELQLPIRMWFPFDENRLDIFPFVYIWIMMFSILILIVACGCELLLYGFLSLTVTQFEILQKRFERIDVKDGKLKENFIKLINKHEELMKISDKIQEIFSKWLFVSISTPLLLNCLSGLQFTYEAQKDASHIIKYSIFVVFGIFQFLTLCQFSQRLLDSSLSVAKGCFNMNWYTIEGCKVRQIVHIIIMRSQRYKKLRTFLFVISLENFAYVS